SDEPLIQIIAGFWNGESKRTPGFSLQNLSGLMASLSCWSIGAEDGVRGQHGGVFLSDQIAGMNDDAVQKFLTERATVDVGGEPTIVQRDVHTFVNFGFEAK